MQLNEGPGKRLLWSGFKVELEKSELNDMIGVADEPVEDARNVDRVNFREVRRVEGGRLGTRCSVLVRQVFTVCSHQNNITGIYIDKNSSKTEITLCWFVNFSLWINIVCVKRSWRWMLRKLNFIGKTLFRYFGLRNAKPLCCGDSNSVAWFLNFEYIHCT